MFGRIFGFGDLEILTASESGIDRLRMLRDAPGFKRAMLDAKHDLELELSGAEADAGAGLPDADRAGGAPRVDRRRADRLGRRGRGTRRRRLRRPASPMSADEVTRTLASLADLRDRGAISAEEYEAKKADLLSRL